MEVKKMAISHDAKSLTRIKNLSGPKTVLVPRKGSISPVHQDKLSCHLDGNFRVIKKGRQLIEVFLREDDSIFYGYAVCSGKDNISLDKGKAVANLRLASRNYVLNITSLDVEKDKFVVIL